MRSGVNRIDFDLTLTLTTEQGVPRRRVTEPPIRCERQSDVMNPISCNWGLTSPLSPTILCRYAERMTEIQIWPKQIQGAFVELTEKCRCSQIVFCPFDTTVLVKKVITFGGLLNKKYMSGIQN